LYDLNSLYSDQGIPICLGDYNALCLVNREQTRNALLPQFLAYSNLCAINMLPSCKGASNSYVSHDGCYTSMLGGMYLPAEHVDSVLHIDLVDDDCLNVS